MAPKPARNQYAQVPAALKMIPFREYPVQILVQSRRVNQTQVGGAHERVAQDVAT